MRENPICAPTVVLSRAVFERLGPFEPPMEGVGRGVFVAGEDYDYWFRCLRAGVRFHYDPRPLVRHRRHDRNVTNDMMWTHQGLSLVRHRHADLVDDRRLVRRVLANDYFKIGRLLADEGRLREARRAFRRSLRYAAATRVSQCARAAAWMAIVSSPPAVCNRVGPTAVGFSRAMDRLLGRRRPALP